MRVHIRNVLLCAILGGAALPCFPQTRRFPDDGPPTTGSPARPPSADPAFSYQTTHEAAIAALKKAFETDALGGHTDKVINLLLIAAKRDSHFGKVVYDLGLVCSKEDRLDDAIRFYERVPRVDSDPDLAKLAAVELERVQLLKKLESTPEGRRERRFDTEFLELARLSSRDSSTAADRLKKLEKLDPARWEAPALLGSVQASLGQYRDGVSSLETAAKLSPADRRKSLTLAAGVAKAEATYVESDANGQLAWQQQDYEAAARLYSQAWETSSGRTAAGMQAAVAFLMADQIDPAVQLLTRIGQTGLPDYAANARKMLKELGAISDDAAHAAAIEPAGSAEAPAADAADRIRKLVGDPASHDMELIGKTPPPLLKDDTAFIPIPDSDLDAPERPYLSSESIFVDYQRVVPEAVPAPPETAPSSPPAGDVQRGALATEREFAVVSRPAGAAVVLDGNPSTACTTPCRLPAAAGRHTLVATLADYRDIRKILDFEKGSPLSPLDLAFDRKLGTVYVTGEPRGSRIFLDGKETGQTTPGTLLVSEGDHEIGIEANHEVLKTTVRVQDAGMHSINF